MSPLRTLWLTLSLLLLWPLTVAAQADSQAQETSDETVEPAAVEPATPPEASLLARGQRKAAREALVGAWRASIGRQQVRLQLHYDNRFYLNGLEGHYERLPGTLRLHLDPQPDTAPQTLAYQYRFINRQLELSGGDLEEPVVFIRQFSLTLYLAELFDTDVEDIWQRINRIVFIVLVVLAARLLIGLIRVTTHTLIFSDRGPLAMVYRHRKNRARTVHSLVLNLVKYFIYFTALGMIMAELGVNYMTYIASLSVIGLAVGFGSQGLVQDMVTGFFIIFEGQFDVGDMVEISGQSGYVVELGLRMTKLRNYLGQTVVIPNRNIAMVGNYSRGAQRTYIDVQVASTNDALNAMPVLQQVGDQLMQQFEGVILRPLKVTGPTSLTTGEHFVRLHLSIWPNQVWVVNEQIIPRLREALRREQVELVNDRVSAFYHAREITPVHTWQQRLTRRTRKPNPKTDVGAGV